MLQLQAWTHFGSTLVKFSQAFHWLSINFRLRWQAAIKTNGTFFVVGLIFLIFYNNRWTMGRSRSLQLQVATVTVAEIRAAHVPPASGTLRAKVNVAQTRPSPFSWKPLEGISLGSQRR